MEQLRNAALDILSDSEGDVARAQVLATLAVAEGQRQVAEGLAGVTCGLENIMTTLDTLARYGVGQ